MTAVQLADDVWRVPLAPVAAFAHGAEVRQGARAAVRACLAGRPS